MRKDALTRLRELEAKAKADKPIMVTLVFQDGHREEAEFMEAFDKIPLLVDEKLERGTIAPDRLIVEVVGNSLLNAMCPSINQFGKDESL